MASDPRFRTRGLVVAALLSVASLSGADKASNSQLSAERVVETLGDTPDYEIDRKPDSTCSFSIPEQVPKRIARKKKIIGKRKEASLTNLNVYIPNQGPDIKGPDIEGPGIKDQKKSVKKGQIFTESGKENNVPSNLPDPKSVPRIERRVSWGANSYHTTHSGDEYDRTSWPDPYDDFGERVYEETSESFVSPVLKPFGVSLVVLYIAMIVALSVPSSLL
mmetsp:Transcript_18787/g.26187  ORF Transcript_18787/g.26187 Transcript_18787/m.26187 type:complete len:220 (+) Transcript_18787:46-705(+)|eukprot:CAMPEP_0184486986 /NCGR_PEP_ID=MMETSP0113_2-20130426/8870_1 /TAXON_ID=91329 /ORGANISM="Norrisiella sphaerica, Strain BC52" /LENGTH=219 /DNA_ID=CAMNT_0026869087 /DNA_START=26 /DNA_END=688 /DNA_ORIENTATION=+